MKAQIWSHHFNQLANIMYNSYTFGYTKGFFRTYMWFT